MPNFDKERFAQLLERAKGNRSINEYALHSGVSAAYISRLLRGLVETPPGAVVIKKLASKAQGGITIEDLMAAAGYLPDRSEPEEPDPDDPNAAAVAKIAAALQADPELLEFWQELSRRQDLQLMFKQVKDLSPETIRKVVRIIKAIEDEEAE